MSESDGLGASASRGALYTLAGQLSRVGVQTLSLIVLARLLAPEDFGIYAMVLAIIGVGEVFRDFGLSTAAIQAPKLSRAQRSNLFWINSLIGAGLTVAVIAISPLVSWAYNDPRVLPVMLALSATFLINALAAQHRADLNRTLRFGVLSVIDTSAQVVALACAISLALAGAQYWALVAMSLGQALFSAGAVVIVGRWVPRWYRRGQDMGGFMKFGAALATSQLLSYASTNASSVVLGITLGPAAVGYYNRAYQTLMLPLSQLQAPATRVALPVLSRLNEDPARYDRFLLRGQLILLHGITASLTVAAALAQPLFRLLFGDQWDSAVPVFQAFALGGAASAANYAYYWVFLSRGLAKSQLSYSLTSRPLLLAGTVAGSLVGGPMGAAASYTIINIVLYPYTAWWLRRVTHVPTRALTWNGVRAFLVYTGVGLASWLATAAVAAAGEWVQIAVGLGVFVLGLAAALLCLPAFRRDLRDIVATVRQLRRR